MRPEGCFQRGNVQNSACDSDLFEGAQSLWKWITDRPPLGWPVSFQHLSGVPPTVPSPHRQSALLNPTRRIRLGARLKARRVAAVNTGAPTNLWFVGIDLTNGRLTVYPAFLIGG